jgi:hypothetical protein
MISYGRSPLSVAGGREESSGPQHDRLSSPLFVTQGAALFAKNIKPFVERETQKVT